jgi:hypothetical protein
MNERGMGESGARTMSSPVPLAFRPWLDTRYGWALDALPVHMECDLYSNMIVFASLMPRKLWLHRFSGIEYGFSGAYHV